MGLLMDQAKSHNFILSKHTKSLSWVIYHGNTRGREGDRELEKEERVTLGLKCSAGGMPTAAVAADGQAALTLEWIGTCF